MEIRRARLEDAAAIAGVHVRTWQAAYEHVFGAERLAGIDVGGREGLARRMATDANYDCFVAEEDGGIVGFVSLRAARRGGGGRAARALRDLRPARLLGDGGGLRADARAHLQRCATAARPTRSSGCSTTIRGPGASTSARAGRPTGRPSPSTSGSRCRSCATGSCSRPQRRGLRSARAPSRGVRRRPS